MLTNANRILYESRLKRAKVWLVTGAAGFIGSHITETLLELGQVVVGFDNFSTGRRANLEAVAQRVDRSRWANFRLVEADICDIDECRLAMEGVNIVLHQAAIGSVPRSIDDPLSAHENNLTGTLKLLIAAQEKRVERFVYASSSSVYGDNEDLPKTEDNIGSPLSPYAVTKATGEKYASVWATIHQLPVICLRYFNVFGPRQNPEGPYAAVVPKWIEGMMDGTETEIYGDGETSRDFCYVENIVQANLLAATTEEREAFGQAFNIAVGTNTTLNELFVLIRERVFQGDTRRRAPEPKYRGFRPGDVRHSLADISKARKILGYEPSHRVEDGLAETVEWFRERASGG